MSSRTRIFSTVASLTLAAGLLEAATKPCHAEGGDTWLPWSQAVRVADQTGRPIVMVVTSPSNPSSQAFRRALAARVAARPESCPAHFTEQSIEADPVWTKKLGITTVPTILVYGRGKTGLVLLGRKSPPFDDATALAWLADVAKPAPIVHRDAAVVRTLGHHNDGVQPSPQQVGQPQVGQPQVTTPSPQPVTMTVQSTPTVATPITGPQATPVVVQSSSPAVVLQPSPMQVMVGPSPAPVVTFIQGTSPNPQVSLATPSPTQQNLFVSGPQPQPQQPSLASPQQQTQVSTPSVSQTPTVQQQTVQFAPTVQTGQPLVQSSVGNGVQTALVLQQPNLINRLLAPSAAISRRKATRRS